MIHWLRPAAMSAIVVVPFIVWLSRYADRMRDGSMQRFAPAFAGTLRKSAVSTVLSLAAIVAIVAALGLPVLREPADPIEHKTGDVVFLLDLSRSMLSRDGDASRLQHAKGAITRVMAQLTDERVALVVFAGSASVECPLTVDYAHFNEVLANASREHITKGGTKIGTALAFTARTAFDDVSRTWKLLVLVTDGGEQGGELAGAARAIGNIGLHLSVIGVGDPRISAIVPQSEADPSPFLFRGQPVRTVLEEGRLRALGHYQEAREVAANPVAFYREQVRDQEVAVANDVPGVPLYPWLAAMAALLLAANFVVVGKARPKILSRTLGTVTAAAAMFLISCYSEPRAPKSDLTLHEVVEKGNEQFGKALYTSALDFYDVASRMDAKSPEIAFNRGIGLNGTRQYRAAVKAFELARTQTQDSALIAAIRAGAAYALVAQAEGDVPGAAVTKLVKALSYYREASRLNPEIVGLRNNIEIVKLRLAKVREAFAAAPDPFLAPPVKGPPPLDSDTPEQILSRSSHIPRASSSKAGDVPEDW